jgi:hypothetical protein
MNAGRWKRRAVVSAAVLMCQLDASGDQYAFTGARATGMAGANTVTTRDSTAIWHNPAAFGFMAQPDWSGTAVDKAKVGDEKFTYNILGAGGGYTLTENLGRYLDILAKIDFDALEQGILESNGENVRSLLSLSGVLSGLSSGDSLYADATAGMSMQIGHFGIGIRAFGEGVAYAIPDLNNLALISFDDGDDLASDIAAASTKDDNFDSTGYTFTVLTPDQQADLNTTLTGPDADDAIKYIDFTLQKLADAGDLTGSEISGAIDTIAEFLPDAGGSIESNQTVVVGRGFAVVEIPVSYGWALNENLSIGATARLMYGSVLGTQVWIFNEDNETVLEDLSDNVNSSLNFGLDLGAIYRSPYVQFALVGRNLNRPTFDGFTENVPVNGADQTLTIPDVTFDPQITFGTAFMPSKRFTLEASLDLLEAGSLLNTYDIQRFSVGGEFDVWLLALRLGAYRNLAASWQDWVATAGVGVNLAGFRVDLAGAYSIGNNAEYDGNEIPSEARLSASIGLDF